MYGKGCTNIADFYVAGINYRKTDATMRGQFAVSTAQYASILTLASSFCVKEFFIISTCNRTEIYGFAESAEQLIDLLCTQTEGSAELFSQLAYTKKGSVAIRHLYKVGAGLDSQVLGDYEIVGQIKKAVTLSKEAGYINVFTDRLVNSVLQSSKAIKNQTALSGGTISVSFAAIQYIREHVTSLAHKNILLLGTGKIGRNSCKNIIDYLDTKNITLINRTEEKAIHLAKELGLRSVPIKELSQQIAFADIILAATSSAEPFIMRADLENSGKKLIIDLSVPYNVETGAAELSNITLVNVDELSRMKDETLAKRVGEIPKAMTIIAAHIAEFISWYQMRENVPVLKAVKTKLKEMHASPLFIPLYDHRTTKINTDEKIQRVINGMASKMRIQDRKGCQYIEAINEFMTTGIN
ncbi:MAG: glutamyl-tRNA reductase [Bacteroidota bacterium]